MAARTRVWASIRNYINKSQPLAHRRSRVIHRAAIETLEPRILLSAYVVTSNSDNGVSGTLRYEIQQAELAANATGDNEIITFASTVTGTIDLNGSALAIDNTSGEVTIEGPGSNLLSINGQGTSQVFTVGAGSNAEIEGLKLTNGYGNYGGGIYNEGTLTISNCIVTGNTANSWGGGIYNAGALTVDHSTVSNNTVGGGDGQGGGIYNETSVTISNSTISGNSGGKGGGLYNYESATVENSSVALNSASVAGGGIYDSNEKPVSVLIVNSSITGNQSAGNGGGLANYSGYSSGTGYTTTIEDSTFELNSAQGDGGGIANYASLNISNCTFAENSADGDGGGIANNSTATITDSTIADNGIGIQANGSTVLDGTIVSNDDQGDISGTVTGEYNLIGDGSGGLSSAEHNLIGNADLEPIESNHGGTTDTFLLEAGSAAIGHGAVFDEPDGTTPITTDQRGYLLPSGTTPDIGSYQTQAVPPLTITASGNSSVVAGAQYTLNLAAQFPTEEQNAAGIVTWTINWGDGTMSNPDIQTVTGNPFTSNSIAETHTYTHRSTPYEINVTATDGNGDTASSNTLSVTVQQNPVSITSLTASAATATGTTTDLSGSATDTGGSALSYTWSTIAAPPNMSLPSFSANGGSSANDTTVTFYSAGTYTFLLTATDASGISASSSVQVVVDQTATSIKVTPSPAELVGNSDQVAFKAYEYDQFGNQMSSQPAFDWSVDPNDTGATIQANGDYTNGSQTSGTFTVTATAGSLSGTGIVQLGSSTAVLTVEGGGIQGYAGEQVGAPGGVVTDSDTSQTNFSALINWGDGTSSAGGVVWLGLPGEGEYYVEQGSHVYSQTGIYQGSVIVRDQAGNQGTEAFTAVILGDGTTTDLRATATTYGTINLTWVGAPNEMYQIERSTDGINFSQVAVVPGIDTYDLYQLAVYQDTGLTPNTTYYYEVSIVGDASSMSVASATTATGTGYSTTPLAAPITVPETGTDDPIGYGGGEGEQGDVVQTATLQAGVHYELVASGSTFAVQVGDGTDAGYIILPPPYQSLSEDPIGETIAPGIGVNDLVSGANRYPYWGAYNANHVYEIDIVGNGQPLNLNLHDNYYGDNYGEPNSLQVTIYQALPASAPTVPQNLVAQPQGTSGINLTWSATGDADAQNYLIYRGTSSTFTGNILTTISATPGTTASYFDALEPGNTTTYYYWVAAENGSGTSGPSNVASAEANTNTPVLPQPAAPSPVTGTSVSLSVAGSDPTGTAGPITYTWSIFSEPTGASVQLSESGLDGSEQTANDPLSSSSGDVTATFDEAGNYVFAVTASDSVGLSNTIYIPVTVQQTLTSLIVSLASSSVTDGNTDAIAGAGVDQFGNAMPFGGNAGWSVLTGGVGGTIPNGSIGSQIVYTAPANGAGQDTIVLSVGGLSATTVVNVIEMENVTAVANSTDWITLSWSSEGSAAEYYEVFRGTSADFTPSDDTLIGDNLTTTTFQDGELSAGVTYYYGVYAVDANNSETLVGQISQSTPASDTPLVSLSSESGGGSSGGGSSAGSVAPSNVTVTGINDMELLVSWNNNAANLDGTNVMVSTDMINWYPARDWVGPIEYAPPNATNFIVRQIYMNGNWQFLSKNTNYYVGLEAVNTAGQSSFVTAGPAQLFNPPFSATIVVVAGRHAQESGLEAGWYWSPSQGLPGIAGTLAADGFNVFLTAPDPADDGAINDDGTGLLYEELQEAIARGDADAIGLIGYSWGGGVISDLSNLLWNQYSATGNTWVVYAGTVDAINPSILGPGGRVTTSPAFNWESSTLGLSLSEGVNYYETVGANHFLGSLEAGMPMNGAQNFQILSVNNGTVPLNHSTIITDSTVLNGIYEGALLAFQNLIY